MAHELDFSKGRAAIAFSGPVPWHGLGESILPEDGIDDIRIKAGLDYDVLRAPVQYGVATGTGGTMIKKDSMVLYRSDDHAPLSIVSDRYQVVQPKEVIEFYRDLTEKYGFQLEVVGALKGGKKVWALANTTNAFQLRGTDTVKGYLLLATSYDGSMSTQARFTSIRVVCANTLAWADAQGRAEVVVPHSTKFDANKVKLDLQVGDAWEQFNQKAAYMSERIVSKDEVVRMFLDVYLGLANDTAIREAHADEKQAKTAEKLVQRLTTALFESPGAQLASARGTLWGALQAVTYDVDWQSPSRTDASRLDKAWFGSGDAIKRRAWDYASKLVA